MYEYQPQFDHPTREKKLALKYEHHDEVLENESNSPIEPEVVLKMDPDDSWNDESDDSDDSDDDKLNPSNIKYYVAKDEYDKTDSIIKHALDKASTSITYKCHLCQMDVSFNTIEMLDLHYSVYHTLNFYCVYCKNNFKDRSDLTVHKLSCNQSHGILSHITNNSELSVTCTFKSNPEAETQCPYCDLKIKNIEFEEHILIHQPRINCPICGETFIDTKSLRRHVAKCHKSEIPSSDPSTSTSSKKHCICELCGKMYKRQKGLNHHMLVHTGQHPHACEVCGQAFTYKSSLTSHQIRVHQMSSQYICSICGRSLLSKTALDDHERKHKGEKPYCCEICNKTFSSKAHLSSHKYYHVDEEMKCNLCDSLFKNRFEYYRHRARFHLPPRQKKYHCNICGLPCTSQKSLNDHLRVHTKEKPFKCDMCSKCFGQKELIVQHIKSHFQIRPKKCKTCGKCFPNKQALNVHERIHTGEKPFICRICHQSFNQINSLKRHLKLHNAKYHLCTYCGQDFDVKYDLRLHHRNDHGVQ